MYLYSEWLVVIVEIGLSVLSFLIEKDENKKTLNASNLEGT